MKYPNEYSGIDQAKVDKLQHWRTHYNLDPYLITNARPTHSCAEAIQEFEQQHPSTEPYDPTESDPILTVVGRVMRKRFKGKAGFAHIRDFSGDLQVYFKESITEYSESLVEVNNQPSDESTSKPLAIILADKLDIGDWLEISGPMFRSRGGEVTIQANKFRIISKIVRTLPDKWHGLEDVESRFRMRYLDLIMNPDIRKRFELNCHYYSEMRRFLDARGFLEVQTPILHAIPGGATAEPFKTFYNALNQDMYLRIAPELYLKRLIVGGFEKVYEMARVFRNEGIDATHNPEYTMLELYQAFADYRDIAQLTEDLIVHLCDKVFGRREFVYEDTNLNFEPPFRYVKFVDAFRNATGVDIVDYPTLEKMISLCRKLGLELPARLSWEKVLDEIMKELVEPQLCKDGKPVFLINYPIQLSPLAKRIPPSDQENYVEGLTLTYRFELFINGVEVENAFSELNDPSDQLERFKEQLKESQQPETKLDWDYIRALEFGMPPTGGLGLGTERLFMFLTNQTQIREVLLFPQMKLLK